MTEENVEQSSTTSLTSLDRQEMTSSAHHLHESPPEGDSEDSKLITQVLNCVLQDAVMELLKAGDFEGAKKEIFGVISDTHDGTSTYRLYNLARHLQERGEFLRAILLNLFYLHYSQLHGLEADIADVTAVCCENISYVTRHLIEGNPPGGHQVVEDHVIPLMLRLKDQIGRSLERAEEREKRFVHEAWCLHFVANVYFYLGNFPRYVCYLDIGLEMLERHFGRDCDNHRIYRMMATNRGKFDKYPKQSDDGRECWSC